MFHFGYIIIPAPPDKAPSINITKHKGRFTVRYATTIAAGKERQKRIKRMFDIFFIVF